MKTIIGALSVFMSIGNAVAWAEGLPITPGMWETTTTTESSVMGTRTDTSKNCIKDTELDPTTQMQGMPKDQCQVNAKVNGKTMTYDLVCAQSDAMKMTFNGSMTVDGDNMEGNMQMEGDMAGQKVTMSVESTGKRVGDC